MESALLDFCETTVELTFWDSDCTCAKLKGSHLGVVVTEESGGRGGPPKIQDLIPGSWAQRSDVLCVGDVIVGVNGVQASSVSRQSLRQVRMTHVEGSFLFPCSSYGKGRDREGRILINARLPLHLPFQNRGKAEGKQGSFPSHINQL